MLITIISERGLRQDVMNPQNQLDSGDSPQLTLTLRAGVPLCTDGIWNPDAKKAVAGPADCAASPPADWEATPANKLTEQRTRHQRWLE
jgi:hypothetical protein